MHRTLLAYATVLIAALLSACETVVPDPSAPRPLGPLSGATVSSAYPTFHWQLGANSDGVRVLVCADRATCLLPVPCDADADAGEDATADIFCAHDAGFDAGFDAGPDAATDAATDAAADGATDAEIAAPDAGPQPEYEMDLRGSMGMPARRPSESSDAGDAGPTIGLSPGIHYWRAIGLRGTSPGGASPIWQFVVAPRQPPSTELPDAAVEFDKVSSGARADFNADGYTDLVVGSVGAAVVYLGSATGLSSTPSVVLDAPDGHDDAFGASVGVAGDVNGDGYPDLFVVAEPGPQSPGRVYVYLGNETGVATSPNDSFADIDGSGNGVASAASGGDLNADGYADLIVADPAWHLSTSNTMGRVIGYMGGPLGPSASQNVVVAGTDGTSTGFGVSLAYSGDMDGDGFPDLFIGGSSGGRAFVVQSVSVPQTSCPNPGVQCGGTYATPSFTLHADVPDGGPESTVVASAGDINNDGHTDVVVAVGHRLSVFLGSGAITEMGLIPSAVIEIPDVESDPSRVLVLSRGDINNDGFSDVIVGAEAGLAANSAIYIFTGSMAGLATTPAIVLDAPRGAFGFGRSVAGIGDVNGDGYDDIAAGASGSGAVFVYLGGAAGPSSSPAWVLTGSDPYAVGFGRSIL